MQNNVLNVKCDTASISIINQLASDEVVQPKFKNWNYVYFQHLRKTGGTSVVDGVFHQNDLCAGNRCIIWSAFYGIGKNMDDHKRKCDDMGMKLIVNEWYPFYTSHYLIHKDDKWNDVLLTTLLRDPIQRVWSDIKNGATFHCGGNITMKEFEEKLNDESFLIECAKQFQYGYTSNLYVKVFSGSWKYAINDPEYHLKKHNIDYNPTHIVHKVHLDIAKSIIQEFDVILILELWEETSIMLKCNQIQNTKLEKLNIGGHSKHKLDQFPNLNKVLHELNQYDIEFYEFAKKLAMQRIEGFNENIC